jgi:hypothetical protein
VLHQDFNEGVASRPPLRATEAWSKVEMAERFRVLGLINDRQSGPPINMDRSQVERRDLPFLPSGLLYRVTDADKMPVTEFRFLRVKDDLAHLDGTNAPIYAAASAHGLTGLDAAMAAAYVRFFFDHVAGRHRGFRIVETAEDLVLTGIATAEDRDRLAGHLRPVALVLGDGDRVVLGACMVFRNALFAVKLEVQRQGRLRIFDETLLLDDQPVVARLLTH